MSSIAIVLREEIRRLARKEVKAACGETKQTVAQYRREIAGLKRQLKAQQKQIAGLKVHGNGSTKPVESAEDEGLDGVRFSARSVRSQRKRLGFSMADYAKLLGVSPITIYYWESGRSRPRSAQLASLVAIRGIAKREAIKRLQALDGKKDDTLQDPQ